MSKVVKVSELEDFNEVRLAAGEIVMVINSLDNSLFEAIDEIETDLDFVESILDLGTLSNSNADIVDSVLGNQIHDQLKRAFDLTALITHVDPVYDEATDTFLELYNEKAYLDNLEKISKRYGEIVSKACELRAR